MDIVHRWSEFTGKVRNFFVNRGYLEVSTPLLLPYPNLDPNVEPIKVTVLEGGKERDLWLRTSPEYSMKKLLAIYGTHMFEMGKVFRNNEHTRLHRVEFHMLEWYRVGEDYNYLMEEIKDLLMEVLNFNSFEEIRVEDLFFEMFKEKLPEEEEEIKEIFRKHGVNFGDDEDMETLLFRFLLRAESIIPKGPVFIKDFPKTLCALARLRGNFAERFELYIDRVEVANGWTEETRKEEVRRRLEREAQKRNLPLDEEFIEIHDLLPPCAGCSIGLDRLFMFFAGFKDLSFLEEMFSQKNKSV